MTATGARAAAKLALKPFVAPLADPQRAWLVIIAALAGLVGWALSQRAVFFLVPFFSVLAALAVLSIPAQAIDHERARGFDKKSAADAESPSSWKVLLECRPLLIFAGCAMLFHFANAPLLPLVGQKLAFQHPTLATAMMSSCIIAAQMIMLPIALLVGYKADTWGRKPLFLVGFAILPIRAFLYTLSDDSAWLIAVQLMDGAGAGIYGALTPLVLADLMRGTGRYNVAQGAVATVQGIGASMSGLVAGEIVDHFGYSAAVGTLGIAALVALAAFFFGMPETARDHEEPAPVPATNK
jgi:predicted MFS family arabinose efflux permease